MSFQFSIQRYWLNFKRHRFFFSIAAIILAVLTALIAIIYPGPTAVRAYVNIPIFQFLTGITDVQNPELMLIWVLMMVSSIGLTIFYPVIGIFFGVNILPFNQKEGKELILSTDKSLLRYFLENLLIIIFMIPIVVLPAYLIGIGFLLSSGNSIDLTAITIAFILPTFFVFVVTMVTSLGSAIKSSPKTGYALGGVYFIISFTLNLIQEDIEFFREFTLIKDINLMSQIGAFQHSLTGTWNEEYIIKCLFLIMILILLTIFFLYRTDYIEKRSSYIQKVKEDNKVGILSKFSFIRTPIESILSRVGWKYPAFRDQLQSTAGIFLIYLFVTSLLQVFVTQAYPGDATMEILFTEMKAILDNPVFAAFTFGHPMEATFGGFIILKFFTLHWIFYSPYLFLMTYNIIIRDDNAGYEEITWSMPRTRTRVLVERTIAALVYLWLIIIVNFVALYSGEILLSTYTDIVMTDLLSTALTFLYLGLGYSIFLVIFVSLAAIPKQKYIPLTLAGAFLAALFIPILWYMNQDLSWLQYLSPFYYFDVAGILLNDISLEKVIPEIIIYGVISIIFFASVLKYWTPRRDIA